MPTFKLINQKGETNFSRIKNEWEQIANHPLQSWYWGTAREKTGVKVVRFAEEENGNLKKVFQMTVHKVPFFPIKIGYLPRSVLPSKSFLDFLYDYCKENKIAFVKLEPYVKTSEVKGTEDFFKYSKLKKSPHPLFPKWTIMLDLTKSEEELFKNLKRKTRYNIRLAKRKGVEVKEMSNNKGFEIFVKLYFDTCKRQKYRGHTPEYHRIIWETLKKKIAHILVAFYKGKPVASYELFLYKNILYYPYGGSDYNYRNTFASNLLMWEVVLFGKRHGAKLFDMWGSLPPNYNKSHPWSGFTRFKQGYGGEFVEFVGSWDLVVDRVKYRIFTLLYKIRNFLK